METLIIKYSREGKTLVHMFDEVKLQAIRAAETTFLGMFHPRALMKGFVV